MRLLVIRHAIAVEREEFARSHADDATRPLTPEGRAKMERAASGLRELVPDLTLIASSPLKRALDTATIVARPHGDLEVERVPELAPGASLDRAIAWLAGLPAKGTIGIVGHEPDLSRLVCALLSGADRPFFEFRKGAACLLEFSGPVARGGAVLDWFLGPKHLRRFSTDRD
jgi:phosphohistidine phosphatase